jgi:hypothetical protein
MPKVLHACHVAVIAADNLVMKQSRSNHVLKLQPLLFLLDWDRSLVM